ncbi:Predicted Zn-dependent peptidase [Desulfurobacterium pacificum]|uniref:Predicted Zn-dependent peptidase n=1 Tax=Desulfurobacterium pacificum TaxID=240166 RepID=A0ABY1NJN1_9BACT|nr:pitrilysin family protein [Desulfurobacterium pacificum]SMP10835.1 Predicted Zn-dependent peptidase [Desulfurobacterium pacificum]
MEALNLKNNIEVIFDDAPEVEIVACSVFLPGGSAVEPVPGITTLSLKTGFKRSAVRTPQSFYASLEKHSTSFVPDVSCDYATVRFQTTAEGLKEAFSLFLETAENPDFSEDSFKTEKSTLLAAIKSRLENPFLLAYEKLMSITYENTPYQFPVYGTEETVQSISRKNAENYFKNLIFPEKTVFSFCGKLSKSDKNFIVTALENLKTKETKEVIPCSQIKEDRLETVTRKGSAQSFIMMALKAPSVSSPEYEAFKLLNAVLGEGIGSVLFQELREKRGFAYSTGSLFPTRRGDGRIFLYIGTTPEKEQEALKEMKKIVENLPDFVTEESVKRAKEYMKGSYLMELETRSKRSWHRGFWKILSHPPDYDETFIKKIEDLPTEALKEAAVKTSQSPKHVVVVKDD